MQDEVNTKVVALAIRTGSQSARMTASVLKAAMRKYLEAESQRKQQRAAQKNAQKAGNSVRRGKQSVGQLMNQNQGLTNIEITNQNIKSFERVAKVDLNQYRDTWDCIIVDECHRVAGTPTAVTQFSKVLNTLRARHKYGLSATVHRADGLIKATYASSDVDKMKKLLESL